MGQPKDTDYDDRLETYLRSFRDAFARADQAQAFELYVRGLLQMHGRKNIESMADRLPDTAGDLAQSLHHFVAKSPWRYRDLISRHLIQLLPAPKTVWVIHDGCIPKKGRHSVGVQRQFARDVGVKANCQIAVVLTEVGPTAVPLHVRLYLPAAWQREHSRRGAANENGQVVSKAEIALSLIDEASQYRAPRPIIADDGYEASSAFVDGLASRELKLRIGSTMHLRQAQARFDWLRDTIGLGHFEGRTWLGWHHHAALAIVAGAFAIGAGATLESSQCRRLFPT